MSATDLPGRIPDDVEAGRFFRRHELSGLNLSGISAEVLRANGWLS